MTSDRRPGQGLRIGEVAAATGLTVRAIRHYHARGLLAEPPRDSSGYRRYSAGELVTLVRIARLRALGMPLQAVAAALAEPPASHGLAPALRALAAEVADEITRLTCVRDRLLSLADTDHRNDPVAAVTAALAGHGRLAAEQQLAEREQTAVALVDALHPGGVEAALATMAPVLADPERLGRLNAALLRFRALGVQDAAETDVETAAAALASALPTASLPLPSLDPSVVARLTGAELNPLQLACVLRARTLLEARARSGGQA